MNQECVENRTKRGDTVSLGALIAIAPLGSIHLFKSGWLPSFLSTNADFLANECDFDGYAAVNPAGGFGSIVNDSNGNPVSYGALFQFPDTGNTTPNSVGGIWLVDNAGHVLRYYLFNNPINLTMAGDEIAGFIALEVGGAGYVDVSN